MFRRLIATTHILSKSIKIQSSTKHICAYNFRCVSCHDGHCRQFTTCSDELEKVSLNEMQNLINVKNVVIIDVREPDELVEHGALPRSINIPLGDVENTLKCTPNDQFLKKYGHEKPDKQTPIIFSCMRGFRSEKAQLIALNLGFKNVKNFIGGWTEWQKNQNNDMTTH